MPRFPSSGPLVGRDDELARLRELVGLAPGAVARGGQAVLLGGDAGVGKTRLAVEVCGNASAAGWQVLIGHCIESGGESMPYLPFREALGRVAGVAPDRVAELLARWPALAMLLPGHQGPGAGRAGPRPRAELFDAVWSALDTLAGDAPVLVVVEDAHWADTSTRELLAYLFPRVPYAPVSALVTYRTDDLHRRHPLRADLSRWSRLPGVSRVPVRPLPADGIRDLVRTLLDGRPDGGPDSDLLARIVERSEGNPFYAEELLAAAEAGDRDLSADLVDLLVLRLAELGEDARAVVRALSVGGREVADDLLRQVTGSDGEATAEATADALTEAVDHHVLTPSGPGTHAFRHALLAEAVYADLPPVQRVRWHRAYAGALRRRAGPGVAAELARHALAAGDPQTALDASVAAAAEALAVGGPAEATWHYEQALQLLARRGDAGDSAAFADLVLQASDSATAAGQLHRATTLLADTLTHVPAELDDRRHARLLLAHANAILQLDIDLDPALASTTRALDLPPATELGELRARLLAAHSRACLSLGRQEEGLRSAGEAMELARELGLPAVLAEATTTLASLTVVLGDEEAEQALRAGAAEAGAAGEVTAELRSMLNLGHLLGEAGRLEEAQAAYTRSARRAAELGRPWAPNGVDGRVMAALVAYQRGRWDEALALAGMDAEQAPATARALLEAATLPVLAGRGDRRGTEILARLRSCWERDVIAAITSAAAGIDLYGDAGDLAAAQAVHDEFVTLYTQFWGTAFFEARVRLSGLLLGQYATSISSAGTRERQELLAGAEPLVRAAERAVGEAIRWGVEGRAWTARVRAEHLRLLSRAGAPTPPAELVGAWEEAVAGFAAYGHVPELARSRARLAAALLDAGRRDEASGQLELALPVAGELGAAPQLAEIEAVRGSGGLPAADREDADGPDRLTARELEVLALAAHGRSNREIGAELVISTKTVSVHMSNLMGKLHAASRTEAVWVAQRRGILPPAAP